MKTIFLKPTKATPQIFSSLEKRNLIKTFKPTKKVLNVKPGHGAVDVLYSSAPQFGTHKLICVGLNITNIKLNYHPENEEFIIVKNTKDKVKPLFLIIGLQKYNILEKKAKNGKLSSKDFLALRLEYNNPKTGIFTMLKYTPHCEITLPGNTAHPYFFVTEPTDIKMNYLNLPDYELILALQIL